MIEKGSRVRMIHIDPEDEEYYNTGTEGIVDSILGGRWIRVTFDKGTYSKRVGGTWIVCREDLEEV